MTGLQGYCNTSVLPRKKAFPCVLYSTIIIRITCWKQPVLVILSICLPEKKPRCCVLIDKLMLLCSKEKIAILWNFSSMSWVYYWRGRGIEIAVICFEIHNAPHTSGFRLKPHEFSKLSQLSFARSTQDSANDRIRLSLSAEAHTGSARTCPVIIFNVGAKI